jgi:hypothetical protein
MNTPTTTSSEAGHRRTPCELVIDQGSEETTGCAVSYLARSITLASGEERYPDGGNFGIGRCDLGDSTCSSQWHPHALATSTGSHLTSRNERRFGSREDRRTDEKRLLSIVYPLQLMTVLSAPRDTRICARTHT